MTPTTHAPRSRRRAAAVLLALPLLLTACGGGDDDEAAPRQAYTPQAESSSSSAAPSSGAAEDTETEATETKAPAQEDSPSAAEAPSEEPTEEDSSDETDDSGESTEDIACSGAEFELTEVRDLTCGEALGMLDPFVTSGQDGGRISDVECSVATVPRNGRDLDRWSCDRDAGGYLYGYRVSSGSSSGDDDTAETVACTGQRFWLTEVSDLTCGEALGMLDPFVTSGQEGGRISDVHCSVGRGEFEGETRDEWECTRDAGGSLTAYAK